MMMSGLLSVVLIWTIAILARRANRSERVRLYTRLTDIGVLGGTIVFLIGFLLGTHSAIPGFGLTLAWVAFVFWLLMKLDQRLQRIRLKRAG